jgi:hypothetical protein
LRILGTPSSCGPAWVCVDQIGPHLLPPAHSERRSCLLQPHPPFLPFLHHATTEFDPHSLSLLFPHHSFLKFYTSVHSFYQHRHPHPRRLPTQSRSSVPFRALFSHFHSFTTTSTALEFLDGRAVTRVSSDPRFVWSVQHSWQTTSSIAALCCPVTPLTAAFPRPSCAPGDSTSSGSRQASRPVVLPCDCAGTLRSHHILDGSHQATAVLPLQLVLSA